MSTYTLYLLILLLKFFYTLSIKIFIKLLFYTLRVLIPSTRSFIKLYTILLFSC